MIVWVACVTHEYGESFFVDRTKEGCLMQIEDWCSLYGPSDIEAYFQLFDGKEFLYGPTKEKLNVDSD